MTESIALLALTLASIAFNGWVTSNFLHGAIQVAGWVMLVTVTTVIAPLFVASKTVALSSAADVGVVWYDACTIYAAYHMMCVSISRSGSPATGSRPQ